MTSFREIQEDRNGDEKPDTRVKGHCTRMRRPKECE